MSPLEMCGMRNVSTNLAACVPFPAPGGPTRIMRIGAHPTLRSPSMKPVPPGFRYASYVMATLFLVCAALQFNDPDPARWIAMYGSVAIVSAILPSKKQLVYAGFVLAALLIAWGAYLLYAVWGRMEVTDLVNKMSEKGGAVEEGREAGGLAICAA